MLECREIYGQKGTGYLLMRICGLNKTTLLDYPGHVSAVVFTGGCNFRCPFCHNAQLVLRPEEQPEILQKELFEFLEKRKTVLEGVCITGGEPTLAKDLEEFIRRVKALGYLVKLDTNGYRPQVLWRLLGQRLLDYVAMDVKASRINYAKAAGLTELDLSRIEESAAMLMSSDILYEFRTTVVKGIHTAEDFEEIGRWLEGSQAYYLQAFRENENVMQSGYSAFDKKDMGKFAALAGRFIDKTKIRGMS